MPAAQGTLAAAGKLPDVGTTIFTVMSKLAQDHDAINLSQGFPDFAAPEQLVARVNEHMRAGHNQYAPLPGVPALLEQIALKTGRLYGVTPDPVSEITVTSGATEALFSAIASFVHPGDEVIVLDPAYDSYDPAVRLAGGKPVHIPLSPGNFAVDWQRVRDAITPATRMLVVNTPHNPTGAVWCDTDLTTLADIVRDTNIIVLSDEVYEHIVFDGQPHQSMLRNAELAARSMIVSSFGKTYPCDRLENRLLRGACRAYAGFPPGAPVRAVRGCHADANWHWPTYWQATRSTICSSARSTSASVTTSCTCWKTHAFACCPPRAHTSSWPTTAQ